MPSTYRAGQCPVADSGCFTDFDEYLVNFVFCHIVAAVVRRERVGEERLWCRGSI
jgi:hypothetical protein